MKTSQRLFTLCGLFASVFAFPVFAQDESDDLYFNSKDLKKRKENAKIKAANPERTYYNYPKSGSDSSEEENSANNQFNDPNYTNKYIEAEKNEGQTVQNATTINNNYYYNNENQQSSSSSYSSPTAGWYDNNPYKLRRRARGSRWNVNPVISWNNWSGVGFGVAGSWNSGWNNGFGWNSPYYNGWNSPYYGYGYGINSGFGGCWGWGDPYYNNYYGYHSGYSYGYNSWVGANNWGWNIYNPYSYGYGNYGYGNGFGYNPYYGWRPAVYVPVTYTAPKVNYGPIRNNSNVTNTTGYGQNGNENALARPGGTSGNTQQRTQYSNQTPTQELVRPRERYSQPQQTNPVITPPQEQQNRSRNDSYSAPQGFRGYDNNNGGTNFGSGRSERSSQRSENSFGGGGGNSPSNNGGGGGGLARPR